MQFKEFRKIPRLNREMVVTEKLDGTNAQVYIVDNLSVDNALVEFSDSDKYIIARNETHCMFAGSRTRWITPSDDNYGFANWVKENSEELFKLGEGQHFGEWWGKGIQRNYGLPNKRFSLFNTGRWINQSPVGYIPVYTDTNGNPAPNCISVVPVLYQGAFDNQKINEILEDLKKNGSKAVPGYLSPEGIVIFHVASRTMYKVTCEKDESPKSLVKE